MVFAVVEGREVVGADEETKVVVVWKWW